MTWTEILNRLVGRVPDGLMLKITHQGETRYFYRNDWVSPDAVLARRALPVRVKPVGEVA